MNKISVTLFLSLPLALLFSCSVRYTYITMQVLNPSDTMLPPGTTKLHILDKCDETKIENTLTGICVSGKNQTIFDTTLVRIFLESPTFKNVPFIVQNESEFKNGMKKMSTKGHVLLLSHYKVNVQLLADPYDHSAPFEYDLTYKLKVEFLDAGTLKRYNSYEYNDSDSFEWEEQVVRGKTVRLSAKDLMAYTEIAAAQKYASHIATFWTTEERMLYSYPDSFMMLGYNRLQKNDLEGAISSWKTAYENQKAKIKAYAAYNIALAYEMLDDLDKCEDWLLKSKKMRRYLPVRDYLEIIKARKADRIKLDKVLSISETYE